ncbi:hypothetical protein HI914_01947 [Erysiphe necator]|nr:hypothetical protein HI914_01947 [Erysiphe necator]
MLSISDYLTPTEDASIGNQEQNEFSISAVRLPSSGTSFLIKLCKVFAAAFGLACTILLGQGYSVNEFYAMYGNQVLRNLFRDSSSTVAMGNNGSLPPPFELYFS